MTSDYDSWSTSMPTAPTLVSVKPTNVAGKVFVTWTNTWRAAAGAEIAWTDDPDNWMSNEEPETYVINESASNWYITGLETGKTWYFRVRSTQVSEDATVNTTWSNEMPIDLSSAPATPALYLSEEAITEDGMLTAYWSFASTDGTAQVAAEIVEATYSNGAWSYGRTVGSTTNAQHIDIYAKEQAGWTNGTTKYLALHTRAGSGGMSDYSTPVKLAIAAKPTVSISSTSLSSGNLTALPLSVTVATTSAKKLSLAIERAHDYPFDRPDGTHTDGAEGETVYLETVSPSANNTFSVTLDSLMGRLDDGADYNLVATVRDAFGQTAEATTKFTVAWAHQAWAPTATFVTDETNYTASITPVAGSSYASGDTFDIYRMSIDGPELIYRGAEFGTTYVDPYPAFGSESGYKIVTITQYGDYIDANSAIADYDTTELDPNPYTQLDPGLLVIDFDGVRVELPYNITLSNSWQKDFQRTAYLGGSVTGDHNRTILRDASIGTVAARKLDPATVATMRALASYAGTCHVRTPEGSSFAADVQVSEDMAYNSGTADYSLTIQKVDPEGYDGMTAAEWEEENS
ncbi:MAG: hypothetical protein U0K35_02100 [Prevotella sp.]|nr:hypothetical protein [Prevotella sp.]